MLISPTGIAAGDTRAEQLAFVDMEGQAQGQWQPSSEWQFHLAVYQQREDAKAIVHSHSPFATALACLGLEIPPYHYMVAAAGGKSIRCADYATFGTEALADSLMLALQDRSACLMANHGQLAIGASAEKALDLALEVEQLAAGYHRALSIGTPPLLSDAQMDEVIAKFKTYGQPAKQG